jgi:hypothetical protein
MTRHQRPVHAEVRDPPTRRGVVYFCSVPADRSLSAVWRRRRTSAALQRAACSAALDGATCARRVSYAARMPAGD